MGQCSSLHWCTGGRDSVLSSLHLWDGEGAGLSWCSPFRVLTPPMVASIGSSCAVKYRSKTEQKIRCRAKKNNRRICKHSRSPGIDSKESIPPACAAWRAEPVFADLLSRPGIDFQPRQPYFSYRPVRLHRLAKSIPRNRFLGSINVYKYGHWYDNHIPRFLAPID
jgi:hypothetical protein